MAYPVSYKLNREDLYGHMSKEAKYDLLEVAMICLGEEKEFVAKMEKAGYCDTCGNVEK